MHHPINGWTKAAMIERLREKVPDTLEGSVVEGFGCAYRSPNGCCAVGAFLPDDVNPEDGWDVDALLKHRPKLDSVLPLGDWAMGLLQHQHDQYANGMDSKQTARERCIAWVEENVEDVA